MLARFPRGRDDLMHSKFLQTSTEIQTERYVGTDGVRPSFFNSHLFPFPIKSLTTLRMIANLIHRRRIIQPTIQHHVPD